MAYRIFDKQHVGIVGSYFNINRGDKINFIESILYHAGNTGNSTTSQGRVVSACFWIVDSSFDENHLDISKAIWCTDILLLNIISNDVIIKTTSPNRSYVNTDKIPIIGLPNDAYRFKFIFNSTELSVSKIFFAYVNAYENIANEYINYNEASLTIDVTDGIPYTVFQDDSNVPSKTLTTKNFNYTINALVNKTSITGDDPVQPKAVIFTSVSYRTHSHPDYGKGEGAGNVKSKNGYNDGGEIPFEFTSGPNNKYINNKTSLGIASAFDIPEGRLKDIHYAKPGDGLSSTEPRWVFKRSRLKFILPHTDIQRKIRIQYRILTTIPYPVKIKNGNVIYNNGNWISMDYNWSTTPVSMIICPRDEGIIDNAAFRITFRRAYLDNNDNIIQWSDESDYYFTTYQRPIVNIAYPKKIRNSATTAENGLEYRFTTLTTFSLFANFQGEYNAVSKYVSDALSVLFAIPPPDDSGIPMFARFWLTESRFGRANGKKEINTLAGETELDMFMSNNTDDYSKFEQIVKGENIVGSLGGIQLGDGQLILFSGRFNDSTLSSIGKENKLWTYNEWSNLNESNSPLMPNAWDKKSDNVPDHFGKDNKFTKKLLFRAGYIYNIRIRLFHGAASGAIGNNNIDKKNTYNDVNYFSRFGYNGYHYPNSGMYNYKWMQNYSVGANPSPGDPTYNLPIINTYPLKPFDNTYGNPRPYYGWIGAEDGTSGFSVLDDEINQTYPGYSEVDSNVFEPVCPFPSTKNIVSKHPSSAETGVNQWVTFNYRNLGKSTAAIETDICTNPGVLPYRERANSFGKTFSNIDNPITRIIKMHKSAVDYLVANKNTYFNNFTYPEFSGVTNATIDSYNIFIRPKDFDDGKSLPPPLNPVPPPLSDINANTESKAIYTNNNYGVDSGIRWFVDKPNTAWPDNNNFPEKNVWFTVYPSWTPAQQRQQQADPLGNQYRWQLVINAQSTASQNIRISNTQNVRLPNDRGTYNLRPLNTSAQFYNVPINYTDGLQTRYFYKDVNTHNSYLSCYDNEINNASRRFQIREMSGTPGTNTEVTATGWPALYTTSAQDIDNNPAAQANTTKYTRFFDLNTSGVYMGDDGEFSYGQLYLRVPTAQDCENGIPTTAYGLLPSVNYDKRQGKARKNTKNIIPLTRVSHYLFFKTHIPVQYRVEYGVRITHSGGTTVKTYMLNSSNRNTAAAPSIKDRTYVRFGNSGFAEVYGEDNNNWGRCLTAEDYDSRLINADNGTIGTLSPDGSIETPLMIRYTPLLQPKLATISYKQNNVTNHIFNNSIQATLDPVNHTIKFMGNDNAGSTSKQTFHNLKEFDLNFYYPFIPENKQYYTKYPNGGVSLTAPGTTSDGVKYAGSPDYGKGTPRYYDFTLDLDSNPDLGSKDNQNTDIFGGFGLATAFNVYLVPALPDLSKIPTAERDLYFSNTANHWNYFNQRANYYSTRDILNVQSQVSSLDVDVAAKTVLLGYKVRPTELVRASSTDTLSTFPNYLKDGISLAQVPNDWKNSKGQKDDIGRAFTKLTINISKLFGQQLCNPRTDFTGLSILDSEWASLEQFLRNNNNFIQTGTIYDLVIVPIYSTDKMTNTNNYWFRDGAGTINDVPYANNMPRDVTSSTNIKNLYGSNPLVLYNFLTVGQSIPSRPPGEPPEYDPKLPPPIIWTDPEHVLDSDHAIVFPNVDNALFNNDTGNNHDPSTDGIDANSIDENPGFWLNNSFKLILRMPSYRTNKTKLYPNDMLTIENQSGGVVTTSANDFLFNDIQIHIGHIDELIPYGYPDRMEDNLNLITDKDKLDSLHIISYRHYWDKHVFSKKLIPTDTMPTVNDNRSLVTGGSLDPTHEHYKNRFIEVNLSNAYIKDEKTNTYIPLAQAIKKEGYYIQFRIKTAYGVGSDNLQWSGWNGGARNGNHKWWGKYGIDYRVPIRNYSDVFTNFRSNIKESLPGSLPKNSKIVIDDSNAIIGQSSLGSHGSTKQIGKTNPINAFKPPYFHIGVGNASGIPIVPIIGETGIEMKGNNDDSYVDSIAYKKTYNTNFKIPKAITDKHQHLHELLYIDYIIRSLCKLYYKPKNNIVIENYTNNFYRNPDGTSITFQIKQHLAIPPQASFNQSLQDVINNILSFKTWGWDDSEYNNFETANDVKNYGAQIASNNRDNDENRAIPNSQTNGLRTRGPKSLPMNTSKESDIGQNQMIPNKDNTRNRWNRNKYYRKTINRQDYEMLNQHLKDLVTFIRNEAFTGNHINLDYLGTQYVIPKSKEYLEFKTSSRSLIGNDLHDRPGLGTTNNINHTMMNSNYITNLWHNILSVINPSFIEYNTREEVK